MTPEKIKSIRKKLELSTKQFADRLGISHRTVESWEQGRRPVPKWHRIMIIKIFDEADIF